ncbi:hypothetical protein SPF06_16650 [Sinomonas sp. JGH33]|uniref:Uncharacterized protein n=1 Tax=Sinomonas terricola TaxID=3110330 RepID=A0ABU5TA15_9MICC|nr:hypothetical protein [Sinomonas sp. JGH33]MEA5456365.1 hypothetical protein [Sinomonas sp. JGH33]
MGNLGTDDGGGSLARKRGEACAAVVLGRVPNATVIALPFDAGLSLPRPLAPAACGESTRRAVLELRTSVSPRGEST